MALLWKVAAAHQVEAMAWHQDKEDTKRGIDPTKAISVRKAGFAGYVGRPSWDDDYRYSDTGEDGDSFNESLWDETHPEPTHEEQAHYEEHGDYPDEYHDRHDEAYQHAWKQREAENEPDHEDSYLHDFIAEHGSNTALWQNKGTLGKVDISGPVYATQSHVHPDHIARHGKPSDSWHRVKYGDTPGNADYLGDQHPMFVTSEGRLHVTEGHHRVAAELLKGNKDIHAWHYDLDKHDFPDGEYD